MNDTEIAQTAELLKKLPPGYVPYPIFEQIARIAALPIVEFIPLRAMPDGAVQVLLIERPANDPLFAGLLHTPGTVVRATDAHTGEQDDWPAFKRIMHDELLDTEVGPPYYVGSIFHASKRGAEQAQLYWIEVLSEPRVGTFYDVAALPKDLMESQVAFIKQAADNFVQCKSNNVRS
jgi:hypothetical protein